MSGHAAPSIKSNKPTIRLLPRERLVRRLLLDCRDSLSPTHDATDLKIWITGGWVRDKLLGGESADIDIALSTMTGTEFGNALHDYFSRSGAKYIEEAEKLAVNPAIGGFHKVDKNPKKSKHLETFSLVVFGLSVDFVNLRKEDPTDLNQFGTPLEDAHLRDSTINALFYNLSTEEVEDHTDKGLPDLAARIMRTPLNPFETFLDDPLRILRLIRFASTLGFNIDYETQNCMQDKRIQAAFRNSISRERVGVELGKMISGPNPLTAFELIHTSNLYHTVFLNTADTLYKTLARILPVQDSKRPWPPTWRRSFTTLAKILEESNPLSQYLTPPNDNYDAWVMAAWSPLAPSRHFNIASSVKSASAAIRCTSKTSNLLKDSLKNMDDILAFMNPDLENPRGLSPGTVGIAIKSWGKTWRLQVLYTLLAESVYRQDYELSFPLLLKRCFDFMEYIFTLGLEEAFATRQILTAGEVKAIFNLTKSGSFMAPVIDGIIRWQFEHIDGSKEEATEWLVAQRGALNIP